MKRLREPQPVAEEEPNKRVVEHLPILANVPDYSYDETIFKFNISFNNSFNNSFNTSNPT
jgi:hypothetical protein